MLKIECDMCMDELLEPGALYFSAPKPSISGDVVVEKLHICTHCAVKVEELVFNHWLHRSLAQ